MVSELRVRMQGSKAAYHDYGYFSRVFCLKINHGGAFTNPPKIRYKGGKVDWIDSIDSDVFFILEINNMMKELGYENSSFEYYYKEPNADLDNGLNKLVNDQDVMQMMKLVAKYKVVELYVDHCVNEEPLNVEPLIVDESLVDNVVDNAPVKISTPPVGFEMTPPDMTKSPVRMRGGGVTMRGGGVRMMGGRVQVRGGSASDEAGSSSSTRLRTINGKIVRCRGKGNGSRSFRYPGGITPIGYGVSWDPVDGEPMLGNIMGLPVPVWPIGITPEDCRIHAEAPEKEPIIEQEPMQEPLVRRLSQYHLQQAKEREKAVKGQASSSASTEAVFEPVMEEVQLDQLWKKFKRAPSPGPDDIISSPGPDDIISLD